MTLESILVLALAVAILEIKPGPGMMMLMSRTASQGMKACYSFMLGYLIVTFFYLLCVFASFNAPGLDMVFLTILTKSLAAVYLMWVGFKGLKEVHLTYNVDDIEGHSFFDTFSSALAVTAANPLVIVFYAGILPTIIDVGSITLNDMVLISFVVLTIEFIIPVLYCIPFAVFGKKVSVGFLKKLRIFSSIVIVAIGLYLGYTALVAEDILAVF